jgi:hypothetical protein
MKKRPSLLLEILLACALLAAAAGPLMRKPIELYRTQMRALKEVEKQRLADLAFAEVKVDLLTHQIPWKKLPSKDMKQKIYPLAPVKMNIPYCSTESIERKAILKLRREKIGMRGEIVRLLEIEIQFEPQKNEPSPTKYIYKALVKKMSS